MLGVGPGCLLALTLHSRCSDPEGLNFLRKGFETWCPPTVEHCCPVDPVDKGMAVPTHEMAPQRPSGRHPESGLHELHVIARYSEEHPGTRRATSAKLSPAVGKAPNMANSGAESRPAGPIWRWGRDVEALLRGGRGHRHQGPVDDP